MDFEWMLEIFSQSQCKRDKSYVLLDNKAKLSKGALYSKKKAGNVECHQSLGGQNVCSLFRIAFELELFLLFNLANKILQANFFLQTDDISELVLHYKWI